ncbi:MAG: histone deacetylase [Elusimicrobia bacterium]|nr:histone deacetylase [Elusimicrobiota bacterium]MDE2511612.1 histone deacetylase [Elusimicrobiota bacterium]
MIHGENHLTSIKNGTFLDADTPSFPDMDDIALISLSGALSAADAALAGEPSFSLMRPPGHHAGKDRVAGFCYINNLAVAVARLQKKKPGLKIAVVDFDVHHGDGTESIVLGRENISFVSLHQFPLYPGSGQKSRGNCMNIPLPEGTGGDDYLRAFVPSLEAVLSSKPDLLAVSAGFDAYKEDPIAGLKLDRTTFKTIGSLLAQTKLPRFATLEGGYSEDLPKLVESFLDGFF